MLNKQLWILGPSLPKKGIFGRKQIVNEYYHWIFHIQINLGTTFQLKLTILIFWTKFTPKGYFLFKTDKMNTKVEFCKLELL